MVSLTRGSKGAVVRQPWTDGAYPSDWGDGKRSRAQGRTREKGRASPRPGARTGPVRGQRNRRGQPKAGGNLTRTMRRSGHRFHKRK